MARPEAVQEVLKLCGRAPEATTVCYVGTATYDLPQFRQVQTGGFADVGCKVTDLKVAVESPTAAEIAATVSSADIVVVSGGNTLFATDRWNKLGVSGVLRKAWHDGSCVMAGGSAGAIWVFDGGHSDSADPHYFKRAMLSPTWDTDRADTAWDYIRVPALGLIPGLLCPHHDRIQSNGTPRCLDFDQMMLRHPGERGVAIDHWAALVTDGGDYRVFTVAGDSGSLLDDGSVTQDGKGAPAIWTKEVVEGQIVTTLAPAAGKLDDLVRPATEIVQDARCHDIRKANPE